MATQTRIIGPISAYAIAKSKGYTGTEEQFATEVTNAATNAQTASAAAAQCVQLTQSLPSDYTTTQKNFCPFYSDLLYPVSVGRHCLYNGKYYVANTYIESAEEWNPDHWTEKTVGDETRRLLDGLNAEDTLVNDLHGLVNYQYDQAYFRANPTGTAYNDVYKVARDRMVVTISKTALNNSETRIRLSRNVVWANTVNQLDGWGAGPTLIGGHAYRVTAKLLSGESYMEVEGDGLLPEIIVLPYQTHNSVARLTKEPGVTYADFTAAEGTAYNIALLFPKQKYILNEAKMLVTLRDMTGNPDMAAKSAYKTLETVLDGTFVSANNKWYSGVAALPATGSKVNNYNADTYGPWTPDSPYNFNDSSTLAYTWMECQPGDVVRIFSSGGDSLENAMLGFVDATGTILYKLRANGIDPYTYGEIVRVAPESTAYVYVNCQRNNVSIDDAYVIVCKQSPIAKRTGKRATTDISEDELFMYMSSLYKADAAISVNSEIVPGANCHVTTIAAELQAIRTALNI